MTAAIIAMGVGLIVSMSLFFIMADLSFRFIVWIFSNIHDVEAPKNDWRCSAKELDSIFPETEEMAA